MSLKNRIENLESQLKVQADLLNHDNSAAERLWDAYMQIEMSIGSVSQEQAEEQILKRHGLKNRDEFIQLQQQQILAGGK